MKTIKLKDNKIMPKPRGFRDYLEDYLITLGIRREKTASFIIKPEEEDLDDPYDLENMAKGLSMLKLAIDNREKIFLQVDSDVDGFTSSAIFYQFFKKKYPDLDITYGLHQGKEHGVELEQVAEDIGFVVIPDAGSMQFEERRILGEKGKKVLVLDHHSMTDNPEIVNNVLINNQVSPNFKNKNMSGAGVVYMFIKAYDEKYCDGKTHTEFLDLAALGIVADMMDTRSLGNNYIIWHGFSQINNRMFQELLKKQEYRLSSISNPSKIDVSWYIAPLINGVIRSGSQEEKEMVFRAFIETENEETSVHEYRGVTKTEDIYQKAVRLAANAKSRQDSSKKKAAELLYSKIESEGLDKNKIIIVCLPEKEASKISPNIVGLVAMDLLKRYNKPVLLLRESKEGGLFSGSGRSKDFDGLPSLLSFIRESSMAFFAEGHGNAFGAQFTTEQAEQFSHYANEKLKDLDFDNETVFVDYWFEEVPIIDEMLWSFAEKIQIYGAGIPQPKFAFTINPSTATISAIGAKKDTLKIYYGGVEFIMFGAGEKIEMLKDTKGKEIVLFGRSQINEFNGRKTIQVVIDDIDLVEKKKTEGEALREKLASLL